MKKNLLLFLVLVLVIIFTYFFQEKKFFNTSEYPKDLIEITDFKTVMLSGLTFKKDHNEFSTTQFNYPLNQDTITNTINSLKFIKLIKPIPSEIDSSHFFPTNNVLSITIDNLMITLGTKVLDGQEFYIKMSQNKIEKSFIAMLEIPVANSPDETGQETYYQKESDKYEAVVKLFSPKLNEFYEKKILYDLNINTLSELTFNNPSKKEFKIDTLKKALNPRPQFNFLQNDERILKVIHEIMALTAQNISLEKKPFKNLVSKIIFKSLNNQEISLELYKNWGDRQGYFVKRSDKDFAYELASISINHFFLNYQDLWLKNISKFNEQRLGAALDFKIGKNLNQMFKFHAPVSSKFTISPIDHNLKFNLELVQDLLIIALGIAPFNEGDRISDFAIDDKSVFSRDGVYVEIGDTKLFICKFNEDIQVINLTGRYRIHYYLVEGRKNYNVSWEALLN